MTIGNSTAKLIAPMFVAGFPFDQNLIVEIANCYGGGFSDPWVLLKTEFGVIRMGWRKRVIAIHWELCEPLVSGEQVTEDDVTKGSGNIHAWSYMKAAEYLASLHALMKAEKNKAVAV